MIDDFGKDLRLKAVASKGRKIHLVFLNIKLKPYDATLCHRGVFEVEDEEEDIEDIHKLKAILVENRICKQCKKEIRMFVDKQVDDLQLWKRK